LARTKKEQLGSSTENSAFGAAMPFGNLGFLPEAQATEIEGRERASWDTIQP
jgi:hypothetical protein